MRQRVRAENLTICDRKKQTDVSFSCVRSVIDNEFRLNIVKILRIHSAIASRIVKALISRPFQLKQK